MKQCSKCKEIKEFTEFWKRGKAQSKHGLMSHCKKCKSARNKIRYEENKHNIDIEKKNILKEKAKIRIFNKRKSNPFFAFKCQVSCLIRDAFRFKKHSKNLKSLEYLGANFETVFEHLKQTAINNYGFYDPNAKYHIDHIIPNATAKTEEEFIKLQHYTNLQYLTPEDNLAKKDKLDWKPKKP